MAGGLIFPSSVYLGGASGNLYPNFYVPATNTNAAGAIEGIGVVASLAADATAVIQFNIPGVLPTGTCKLRILAWANATSGAAKLTVSGGETAVGSNIGAATLTAETQISQTWSSADIIVENKITLTDTPTASNIYTIKAVFNTTSWTLAAPSTWQFSLVWE